MRKEISHIPQLMGITQTADFYGVSKYFLRKGIKEGRIAHAVIGNRYMIDVDAFQRQIDSNVDYHTNRDWNKE